MKSNPLLSESFATPDKLRIASDRWTAAPFIYGIGSPSVPTRMLSKENVYEGWCCTSVHNFSKTLITPNSRATLRLLQDQILSPESSKHITYPYIWWIYCSKHKVRAIHEDAAGINFVKLGSIWQLAYPFSIIGGLVGAQGASDQKYESVPASGYFVVWENETIARKHAG